MPSLIGHLGSNKLWIETEKSYGSLWFFDRNLKSSLNLRKLL